jgi:hypothetical protein
MPRSFYCTKEPTGLKRDIADRSKLIASILLSYKLWIAQQSTRKDKFNPPLLFS